MKICYSIKDACIETSFSKDRLYRALRAGELTAKRVGGRTVILREELERWIAGSPEYKPRKIAINERRRRREPVAA
jgi:excisionase family DNA binding protein